MKEKTVLALARANVAASLSSFIYILQKQLFILFTRTTNLLEYVHFAGWSLVFKRIELVLSIYRRLVPPMHQISCRKSEGDVYK